MSAMTEAEKLDAILRGLNDAAAERTADRARLDAYCAKVDAAEKERADAAEKARLDAAAAEQARADAEAADKALADAAEAERVEAKRIADAAAAEEISTLSKLVPAQVTSEIRQRLVTFQTKAERVAQAFGDSAGAPTFVNGEAERDYRVRLLSKYQLHSAVYKDSDLAQIGDDTVFTAIEDAIYADALNEATNPRVLKQGVLIPQKITDSAGRTITKYAGQDGACWDQFNPPIRHVRRFLTPGSARA
jgi:hypothetical protein